MEEEEEVENKITVNPNQHTKFPALRSRESCSWDPLFSKPAWIAKFGKNWREKISPDYSKAFTYKGDTFKSISHAVQCYLHRPPPETENFEREWDFVINDRRDMGWISIMSEVDEAYAFFTSRSGKAYYPTPEEGKAFKEKVEELAYSVGMARFEQDEEARIILTKTKGYKLNFLYLVRYDLGYGTVSLKWLEKVRDNIGSVCTS